MTSNAVYGGENEWVEPVPGSTTIRRPNGTSGPITWTLEDIAEMQTDVVRGSVAPSRSTETTTFHPLLPVGIDAELDRILNDDYVPSANGALARDQNGYLVTQAGDGQELSGGAEAIINSVTVTNGGGAGTPPVDPIDPKLPITTAQFFGVEPF